MLVEMYLKHMKEITDKLTSIRASISGEDKFVLLGGLPPSHSTLVTALEACVNGVILNFVQQALIHKEQKLNAHSSSSLHSDQSSSAIVGAQQRSRSRKSVKRFGCGEVGHFRHDCPQKKHDHSRPAHNTVTAKENQSHTVMECLQHQLTLVILLGWASGLWTLEHPATDAGGTTVDGLPRDCKAREDWVG